MKTKQLPTKNTSFITATQPPENHRAEYLAAHPSALELQTTQIAEINAEVGEWLSWHERAAHDMVDGGEKARRIGIKINAFAETFPGRKLTYDFWLQVQREFRTPAGRAIPLEMLEWFMKVARANPQPITKVTQIPPLKEFLLIGEDEFEAAKGRAPQTAAPPANPYNSLTARLRIEEWRADLEQFRKHKQFGDLTRLRETRPDLHHELVAKFKAVHDLSETVLAELGSGVL